MYLASRLYLVCDYLLRHGGLYAELWRFLPQPGLGRNFARQSTQGRIHDRQVAARPPGQRKFKSYLEWNGRKQRLSPQADFRACVLLGLRVHRAAGAMGRANTGVIRPMCGYLHRPASQGKTSLPNRWVGCRRVESSSTEMDWRS